MNKVLLITIFTILFTSCGKNSELWPTKSEASAASTPAQAEEYSYELSTSKCSTGVQSSPSFFTICEKLQNHELNKNCAEKKRMDLFQRSQCPGEFKLSS